MIQKKYEQLVEIKKKNQPVQKRISIILSLKSYPLKQWKHSDKLHKLQSLHFSIFA